MKAGLLGKDNRVSLFTQKYITHPFNSFVDHNDLKN